MAGSSLTAVADLPLVGWNRGIRRAVAKRSSPVPASLDVMTPNRDRTDTIIPQTQNLPTPKISFCRCKQVHSCVALLLGRMYKDTSAETRAHLQLMQPESTTATVRQPHSPTKFEASKRWCRHHTYSAVRSPFPNSLFRLRLAR